MITEKMTIGVGMVMAALVFASGCGNGAVSEDIESLRKEVASLKAEVRGLRKAIDHRQAFDRDAHRERRMEVMRSEAAMRRPDRSLTNGVHRVRPPAGPQVQGAERQAGQMDDAMRERMEQRRMEMRRRYEAEREAKRKLMEERRRKKEQALGRGGDAGSQPAPGKQ